MLRIPIGDKPRKLKGVLIGSGSGPQERILQLQYWVTDLLRHERIEGREYRMEETRLYAEQLISLAVHYGPKDHYTMKMADQWLKDKDLVHKLFKVLVPRYQNYSTAFTQIYRLPAKYPGLGRFNSVLELRGNPYPPVLPRQHDKSRLLTNVLLAGARNEFYSEQGKSFRSTRKRKNEANDEKKQDSDDVKETEV